MYRAPRIDGVADEREWVLAPWRDIAYTIIDSAGAGAPAEEDISGRYKVVWTRKALYLLAEVFDDRYLPGMSPHELSQSRQWLSAGKTLGFMVSLIDADGVDLNADGGQDREYFMGDVDVPVWQEADGGFPMPDWMGKNRGWVDASVFGNLKLVKGKK